MTRTAPIVQTDERWLDLMASLRLEDGRAWGEAAAPFQLEDARAILVGDGPRFHFLTRARGGSKTSDLAGLAIVELLRQRDGRLYALASDQGQGGILLDALAGFVNRSPSLREHLRIGTWKVTCPRTRSSLEILAADSPGAWGLRPDFVVVEEFSGWAETRSSRTLWTAVSSAVAKVPGSRLVILTTAGDPAHFSAKILEHAKADAAWRVNEVPGPAPWMDAEDLAAQERMHPASIFRRLFHNEWQQGEDRLTSPEDLAECVVLDGPLEPRSGVRYVLGLDVGLTHDRTVAAIMHREREGLVVLDRVEVWAGSKRSPVRVEDVEDWILEARRQFRVKVVADPWQSKHLAQRLRERRVPVDEFTFSPSSVGRLATTLHLLIRDRALALPDDPELLDELANVRLRETSPGVMRMDHDPDKHDDRAIAIALAAQHLLERGPRRSGAPSGLGAVNDGLWSESPADDGSGHFLERGAP